MISRYELEEKMNEFQINEIALEKISHKGFNSYIVKDNNGNFEELNCITFYNGEKIKYVCNIDYVANVKGLVNYIEYCKKELNKKLFTKEDVKTISNYTDYRNKVDFVCNRYYQVLGGKTIYSDNVDIKKYKYKYSIFLFDKEENLNEFIKTYDLLKLIFKNKMELDKQFFKSAVKYEMFNHESPIDYDGWNSALSALGIRYKDLDDEYKIIVKETFKEVCNAIEW